MPELTHEGSEDGFHEIQLSGKQVVFLFMVTTVVSVMIFLCGVLVGRGVRADRGPEGDAPIAGATIDRPAETTSPSASAPPATSPPTEAPPPADEQPGEGSAAPKGESAAPKAEPPAVTPAPQPKEQAPLVTPKPEAVPQAASGDVPTSGRPGTWVVQVSALQNRGAASGVVRRLIAKGYPAFLLTPPAGTPQIFRVQIGKYSDRREAEQVARRIEKEEQFKADIKR